jgi:Ca2+-binding RTX toxin-like protein
MGYERDSGAKESCMKNRVLGASALAMACGLGCSSQSGVGGDRVLRTDGAGVSTLLSVSNAPSSPANGEVVAVQSQALAANAGTGGASIFYPKPGAQSDGVCFIGLFADSAGNLYPVSPVGVFKILPDGTLVNNESNLFLKGTNDFFAALDQPNQTVYSADSGSLRSAPFSEGSTFADVMPLAPGAQQIALGRGPLAGSLFSTRPISQTSAEILRVVVSPPSVTSFTAGLGVLETPVASAPDGTQYVADLASNPTQLIRISTTGSKSVVATGTSAQANRSVAVDEAGNVYWSQATGINVYSASGQLSRVLPGPPDKAAFQGPSGMAFDPQGNLYLVDNLDCKKIYKYDLSSCVDTAAPVFTFVPPSISTTSCGAIDIGKATAMDACGAVTVTNDAPANFPPGTMVVTWTAVGSGKAVATATERVTRVLGNDPACCPAGTHVILGTSNNDHLTGTAGPDCILGLGGQDVISGLGGNDFISAGDGDDRVSGGDGDDVIFGGSGQDTLNGNAGSDWLEGGDGDDWCFGGDGNDSLSGGAGNDQLFGDNGNDSLVGGLGDDRLEGGAGDDVLDGSGAHDTCIGGLGLDTFLICQNQTQ